MDLAYTGLDLTPIPFAGSACTLGNGIRNGDVGDIVIGGLFMAFDAITFGQGHYVKGVSAAAKGVSALARRVRQGGKILKAFKVGCHILKDHKT